MKINFEMTGVPVKLDTGPAHTWTIYFKRLSEGRSDIEFRVLSGGEVIAVQETSMTPTPDFVIIPFTARNDGSLSLEVVNHTDTAELAIISQKIGVPRE